MDAITLLKNDHKTVEKLFKSFEKAGDGAYVEKRRIVDRIIEELSVHAAIEEQVFYPVVRATVDGIDDDVLEALEEHHVVKTVLAELEDLPPDHERFVAKVTVLIENVRHHVEEEEDDLFPKVRDELGRSALGAVGDALELARNSAPTHPHPLAPDTPPGNVVAGTAAGVTDRIGDTVSGLAQGGVTAIGDVIATVLRRKRSAPQPTGSTVARRTATRVRGEVADATQAVIDATKEAKHEGQRASTAAKRTTKKAAKRAPTKKVASAGAKRPAAKRVSTATKRASTPAKRPVAKARTTSA